MRILRRIRGILGMALVWGIAWAIAAGILVLGVDAWSRRPDGFGSAPLLALMLFYGLVGLWAGAMFASVLAVGDGRRTFADLAMHRVITWGVLGGVSYPLVVMLVALNGPGPMPQGLAVAVGLTALLGGGSAAATLALARRIPRAPQRGGPGDAPEVLGNPDGSVELPLGSRGAIDARQSNDCMKLTSARDSKL